MARSKSKQKRKRHQFRLRRRRRSDRKKQAKTESQGGQADGPRKRKGPKPLPAWPPGKGIFSCLPRDVRRRRYACHAKRELFRRRGSHRQGSGITPATVSALGAGSVKRSARDASQRPRSQNTLEHARGDLGRGAPEARRLHHHGGDRDARILGRRDPDEPL